MRPVEALTRHASSWGWLVTVSAFALLTAGLVMVVWWAATDEERTSTYNVRGSVTMITLDMGEANLQIVGGGSQPTVQVSHTDRYAFGHPAQAQRIVKGGTLELRARCPAALLGSCSSTYRLRVPDNVPVRVKTTSGSVSVEQLSRLRRRSTTRSGDVELRRLVRLPPPGPGGRRRRPRDRRLLAERLELRSSDGDVRAVVPRGRYRVDAVRTSGAQRVRGLTAADDAPFQIQALSTPARPGRERSMSGHAPRVRSLRLRPRAAARRRGARSSCPASRSASPTSSWSAAASSSARCSACSGSACR